MNTLRLFLLVVLTLLSVQVWGLDCSSADIHLNTQEDVDTFQATFGSGGVCDTVTGRLQVWGSNITNINGLAELTSVGRNLDINNNPALTNIDGLTGLSSVGFTHDGWDLNIHNNATLTNIDGLIGLTKIEGRLNIGRNPVLANLNGLANITSVRRGLSIYGNAILTDMDSLAKLTRIDGSLNIFNNKKLVNIDGLVGLTSIGSVLTIAHNKALTNIAGLANLTNNLFSLEIYSNATLIDIDSLPKLTSLMGFLRIYDNAALTSINGLTGLTSVDMGVNINDNKALNNIHGLTALSSAGVLRIENNGALTSMDGLSALNRVGGLYIYFNNALININSLSGLTSVGNLGIVGNIALTNIDGLSGLTSIQNLSILTNASLTNIDGLSNLTSIVGFYGSATHLPIDPTWGLYIKDNGVLSNIDGLSRLINVRDHVNLISNTSLASCTGLNALLDAIDNGESGPGPGGAGILDVGRDVTIENNLQGCNSVGEILDLPLEPPVDIKATDGAFLHFVRIVFDPVPGATVYRVLRCSDQGDTCGLPIGYTNTGSFNDTKVTPGTVYYYRVRACIRNICGNISAANTGYATIQPERPTGIRATDGTFPDRVNISWNGVESATVYRVFRCLDTNQTCSSPVGFPNGTSFNDRKGDPGTVYFYRVKACNTQHCSKFSVANAGHRSATPALEINQPNTFLLPDQQVPIPAMSTWGRLLLILTTLGFGMALTKQGRLRYRE